MSTELANEIVVLRTRLLAEGLDAGALTIQWHLAQRGSRVPSISEIVRLLRRRGLVVPHLHKRPRSSFIRFRRSCPTSCGRSTRRTGRSPVSGASRSSTCSTTTPPVEDRYGPVRLRVTSFEIWVTSRCANGTAAEHAGVRRLNASEALSTLCPSSTSLGASDDQPAKLGVSISVTGRP